MDDKKMLHYRIAERGKMHALDKNYKEALRHYQEALKLTQNEKDSELFFQHYSQCVMESLEQLGSYDEVISFCENYRTFLAEKEESTLIKKHNIGICGGRQFIAEHFASIDAEYMMFFEDDMFLNPPSETGYCRNGFRKYVENPVTMFV